MDVEMWGCGDVEIPLPPSPKIIKSAKDLVVFKRSYALSIAIHKKSLTFPPIEQYSLAKQLRNCSKSVCSNLFEGFSKQSQSKAEFKRFITIAIGSANETELWSDYALDLGYIDTPTHEQWIKENNAVIGMLVNLRKKV